MFILIIEIKYEDAINIIIPYITNQTPEDFLLSIFITLDTNNKGYLIPSDIDILFKDSCKFISSSSLISLKDNLFRENSQIGWREFYSKMYRII